MTGRRVASLLFALGAGLLLLNVYGIHRGLRGQSPMLTMPPETMRQEALRGPTETDAAYAVRMTRLVHRGILHAWDTPEAEGLHASLPVWENWIIFALKGIVPSFHRWEFVDADRAIERGIGLCSQQAIVLDEILRRNGVESDILVLDGHVVVEFTQGTPMILDPDFGVVMQGTPHTIRDNLAMVDEAYPPAVAAALRPIYARPRWPPWPMSRSIIRAGCGWNRPCTFSSGSCRC